MIAELEKAVAAEVERLPEAATVALIRRAQCGGADGEAAMRELIHRNIRLVSKEAFRFFRLASASFTEDDIEQEALIGFAKAVKAFNPSRGVRFSTYAVSSMRRGISREIANHASRLRLPVQRQLQIATVRKASAQVIAATGKPPTLQELVRLTGINHAKLRVLKTLPVADYLPEDPDDRGRLSLSYVHADAEAAEESADSLIAWLRVVLPEHLHEIGVMVLIEGASVEGVMGKFNTNRRHVLAEIRQAKAIMKQHIERQGLGGQLSQSQVRPVPRLGSAAPAPPSAFGVEEQERA